MLALTLFVGGLMHRGSDAMLLAGVCGSLLAFLAQAAWTARIDVPGARMQAFAQGSLAAACFAVVATLASSAGRGILAAVGILALVALALRERGRKGRRVALYAWDAHLVSAIALGGIAALLAVDGTGLRVATTLWILVAGGFGAGVLFVRTVRETGGSLLAVWIVSASAAAFATAPEIGPALLCAWCVLPVRLLLVPFARTASWKALGWTEAVLGSWSAIWLVVALR